MKNGMKADPSAERGVEPGGRVPHHATFALLVLLVATVLAVYKPRGMTRYGWRKQHEPRKVSQA